MKKDELIKIIVPALKKHWENTRQGKVFSENQIYHAIKGNSKTVLISRYKTLVEKGYIK